MVPTPIRDQGRTITNLFYHTAAWRNRQTRAPQERVGEIPCGFESRGRDHISERRPARRIVI
jgi:hypothetical protein